MMFKTEDYQCKTEIWENFHKCDTTEKIPGKMY